MTMLPLDPRQSFVQELQQPVKKWTLSHMR